MRGVRRHRDFMTGNSQWRNIIHNYGIKNRVSVDIPTGVYHIIKRLCGHLIHGLSWVKSNLCLGFNLTKFPDIRVFIENNFGTHSPIDNFPPGNRKKLESTMMMYGNIV